MFCIYQQCSICRNVNLDKPATHEPSWRPVVTGPSWRVLRHTARPDGRHDVRHPVTTARVSQDPSDAKFSRKKHCSAMLFFHWRPVLTARVSQDSLCWPVIKTPTSYALPYLLRGIAMSRHEQSCFCRYTPCLKKKLCQCYFVNNSVKHWPNLIIFGTQHRKETRHKRP